MPHTSRKKRGGPTIPVQKRLQVTDDDGWTHITSGGNVRRVVRSTAQSANAGARGVNNNDHDSQDNGDSYDMTSSDTENDEVPVYLLPAEAPSGLTEEALQRDFDTHRRTWETSETCQALLEKLGELRRDLCGSKTILDSHVQEDSGLSSSLLLESLASTDLYLDAIVCIGLGSPSGFLRGGRIDRRTVSLYQLAALVSIKKQLSRSFPPSTSSSLFLRCANSPYLTSISLPSRTPSRQKHSNPCIRPRPSLQHLRPHPPRISRYQNHATPGSLQEHNPQHGRL